MIMRLLYNNKPIVKLVEIYYHMHKTSQLGFSSFMAPSLDIQKINHYMILPIYNNPFLNHDPIESIRQNKNKKGRFIYELTEDEIMEALTHFKKESTMDIKYFNVVKDDGSIINMFGQKIN